MRIEFRLSEKKVKFALLALGFANFLVAFPKFRGFLLSFLRLASLVLVKAPPVHHRLTREFLPTIVRILPKTNGLEHTLLDLALDKDRAFLRQTHQIAPSGDVLAILTVDVMAD